MVDGEELPGSYWLPPLQPPGDAATTEEERVTRLGLGLVPGAKAGAKWVTYCR